MDMKNHPITEWIISKSPDGSFLKIPLIREEKIQNHKPIYHDSFLLRGLISCPNGSNFNPREDKPTKKENKKVGTINKTSQTTKYIIKAQSYAIAANKIYFTNPIREYTEEEKILIAKMLYCEAGGEGWDCQVATCSAIINHVEYNKGDFGVLDKSNHFSPARYYRYKTPTKMNWEVLEYVLSGHLIADVKYFQLYGYHSFGTPMFKVDGMYYCK